MLSRTGIGRTGAIRRGRTRRVLVAAASTALVCHCWGRHAFAESGYFVHISDPHVSIETQVRWQQVLRQILGESPRPDLVLCTGDLVDFGAGWSGSLHYNMLLSPPVTTEGGDHYVGEGADRIPIFFCPGNHDYRNLAQLTEDLTNYKLKVHAMTYFHRVVGSYAIFSLNSGCDTLLTWPHDLPEGSGLFDSGAEPDVTNLVRDLDLLDGVLDGRDASGFKKIVLMHHPHQYPDAEQQICSLNGAFRRYSGRFVDACRGFGVGWALFGHLHPDQSLVYDLGCADWTPGETKCIVAVSSRTAGYRREWQDGSGQDVIFASVPALTTWGIAVLALLVLTSGALCLRRWRCSV